MELLVQNVAHRDAVAHVPEQRAREIDGQEDKARMDG